MGSQSQSHCRLATPPPGSQISLWMRKVKSMAYGLAQWWLIAKADPPEAGKPSMTW